MFLNNSSHIRRCKTVVNTCCRLLNTQVERQPLAVNILKENAVEKKVFINDIKLKLASFFNSHYDFETNEVPEIKTSLVPKKFFTLKESKCIKYSFTVDDHVAEKAANHINEYIAKDDLVLESNPGLGLITHHLLQSRANKIYVCQSEELMPSLKNLIACSSERLSCLPPGRVSKYETTQVFSFIEKLFQLEKNEQKLKAVLVLHELNFLTDLCRRIVNFSNWHFHDNVELYVIINSAIKKKYFSNKFSKYASYVTLNSLMNCQMLCELPRESFLPWPKKSEGSMFLYRIAKNPKAFDVIRRDEYGEFYKFLKILGRSKYNYVIKTLEHWAPGCGCELMNLGITTWTRVIDLSVEQAISLYSTFKSSPGYENYKLIITNEHKGLIVEEEEYDRIENVENVQHFVVTT